jgi:hypothetical protein
MIRFFVGSTKPDVFGPLKEHQSPKVCAVPADAVMKLNDPFLFLLRFT